METAAMGYMGGYWFVTFRGAMANNGILEKIMETAIIHWDYIGIMETTNHFARPPTSPCRRQHGYFSRP